MRNIPPPPTPCSTDVCEDSEPYVKTPHHQKHHATRRKRGNKYYTNVTNFDITYEPEPSPPPPTPIMSDNNYESCPPSPSTERSFFNPYPPPPSPATDSTWWRVAPPSVSRQGLCLLWVFFDWNHRQCQCFVFFSTLCITCWGRCLPYNPPASSWRKWIICPITRFNVDHVYLLILLHLHKE